MRPILLLPLLACSCSALQQRGDVLAPQPFESGRFQAHIGVRELTDDGLWAPVEDQTHFGVSWSGSDDGAPIAWDVGFSYSEDDGSRLVGGDVITARGSILELDVGALAVHDAWRVQPYVGAGVSLLRAEADVRFAGDQVEDSDTTFGVYARAGLMIPFHGGEVVGIDVRRVFGADVELGGSDGDADGTIFALTFGYGF